MEMSNDGGDSGLDLKSKAAVEWPQRKIELKQDLKQLKAGEYKGNTRLTWAEGQALDAVSFITVPFPFSSLLSATDNELVLEAKRKGEDDFEYDIKTDVTVSGAHNRKYEVHQRVAAGDKVATYKGYLKSHPPTHKQWGLGTNGEWGL